MLYMVVQKLSKNNGLDLEFTIVVKKSETDRAQKQVKILKHRNYSNKISVLQLKVNVKIKGNFLK